MHSSAGHLTTCSVCGPVTHFPLVRYTAPPWLLRSFRGRLCRALAGLVRVRPLRDYLLACYTAPVSPYVPCTACDALAGPFRAWSGRERILQFRVRPPVCVRPSRAIVTSHSMDSSARRFPTCSVYGPATHHTIVLCTAPSCASPLDPCTAPRCTCRPVPCGAPPHSTLLSVARPQVLRTFRARPCDRSAGPFSAWPRRELALPFRVRPRRAFAPRSVHGPAA